MTSVEVRSWIMFENLDVLIVKYSPTQAMLLERLLVNRGCTVRTARNRSQGLQMIARSRPGLVISDSAIPEVEGYELSRCIKDDPILKDIPVILLTTGSQAPDVARARESCADDYLSEPYEQEELFSRIRIVLRNRGIQDVDHGSQESGASQGQVPLEKEQDVEPVLLSGRVLVAEDSIVNQKLTEAILKNMGLSVDVVADGKDVITALEKTAYDLVLMDVHMPEMDGLEATRRIRAAEDRRQRTEDSSTETKNSKPGDETAALSAMNQEPGTKNPRRHIPIIAMTAGTTDQDQDREDCIEAGMDDYVTKPVVPVDLNELLGRWLSEKKDKSD
jgi:CheY-like chemotaxis protein